MDQVMSHNKSLQLSPKKLFVAVHSVPYTMQCWADAAGQLNSMLYNPRLITVRKVKDVEINTRNTQKIKTGR